MSENVNVGRITQLTEKLDVDAYTRQVVGLIDGCIKGMQRERDEALDALAASNARIAELKGAAAALVEYRRRVGPQVFQEKADAYIGRLAAALQALSGEASG